MDKVAYDKLLAIPYSDSLLGRIESKKKKRVDDWMDRAESGEIMRIM